MPHFDVRFMDGPRLLDRRVEASDAQSVCALLGVPPSRVIDIRDAAPVLLARPKLALTARAFPLRLFSQELAVLLGAGVPLLEALVTLREKKTSRHVHDGLSAVIARLEVGGSFSDAVAARTQEFDALFCAVVAASERTGQLRSALETHARYLSWVDELRARLVAAAIYPAMLVVASTSVMVFLLLVVVPRFGALLDGLGGEIPAGSRLLLQAGQLASVHPALTLLSTIALFALPLAALRHPAWRDAIGRALWAMPGLGERLRLLALARLFRTVSMLIDAGVAVVPALKASLGVTPAQLRASLTAAIERVSRGERLSEAFDNEGLATPVSARMLRVGERSGEVGAMLGRAAAFYDEELARLGDWVTRLVNPLLMLMMGALIGTVVVLLYLPIFQLAEQVQ